MIVKRFVLSSVACVFALSVFSSFRWMPADASRMGQTVPTFTPTPGPATPTSTPEPQPSEPPPAEATQTPATPAPPQTPAAVAAMTASATGAATRTPALLPVTGGDAGNGPVFLIVAGSGLAVTAWVLRLRTKGAD